MKPQKIKIIWALSIASAIFVILLQGYWLYNQYRYSLDETANEIISKLIASSDDYKAWKKMKLKTDRERLKSYNSNMNLNPYTQFNMTIENNITDWYISIQTIMKDAKPGNIGKQKVDSLQEEKSRFIEMRQYIANKELKIQLKKPKEMEDTISLKTWRENVSVVDSIMTTTFRFKTQENQYLIYESVEMFTAEMNSPFKISQLDSIVRQKTGCTIIQIDTLSLPLDSVLWQPKITKQLSLKHPSVSMYMPYNALKRKVAIVTVPLVPAGIIRTMAIQIIVSLILLLTLIVCLLLQIQTISKQQRISRLRQNFVNTTIHELKRPVQMLKTIVAYLQSSAPKEAEILNEARIETDNLTSYLQKLRDVNQSDTLSGGMEFSFFDFIALAKDCMAKAIKNSEKEIDIATIFPETNLMITADKVILRTIIVNLLENAIKYSGDKPQIVFSAEKPNNQLIFSVKDNGVGVPNAEQNHVFEPFFRSKSSYVSSLPGMGLGLSYVKMAVDAFHGSVSLQSEVNKGTVITVKIPQL